MKYAILRTAKLKSVQNIRSSLLHNFREIPTHNADPSLTPLNFSLPEMTNTESCMKIYENRMKSIKTPRKNAVLAVEYLLATSPDWWKESSKQQQDEWIWRNLLFLLHKHGEENLISFTVQYDETTPHISAIVVPEVDGKLNARAFFGGREKMSILQDSYALMMESFGLNRGIKGSKAEHKDIKQYYSEVNTHENLLKQLDELNERNRKLTQQLRRFQGMQQTDLGMGM